MSESTIKVLVVDDSGLMRLLIQDMLAEEQTIEVMDTAVNGKEAYEKTLLLNPHVLVLDLVMKDYDGLYAVNKIMQEIPKPIIILSSAGNTDPGKVLEALNAGAFDFLNKPEGAFGSKVRKIQSLLINKIKQAAEAQLDTLTKRKKSKNNLPHTFDHSGRYEIIVIGASTGGTTAIETILTHLPENLPLPVIIIQHIPPDFGYSFAERLNHLTPFNVTIPQNNEVLLSGKVYIAPSEHNLRLEMDSTNQLIIFKYTNELFKEYNFPSIDSLMISAANIFKNKIMGVILSGMGRAGTQGMQLIHELGGLTIAQNEESCVVYGMPKSAIEKEVIHHIVHLNDIPGFMVSAL